MRAPCSGWALWMVPPRPRALVILVNLVAVSAVAVDGVRVLSEPVPVEWLGAMLVLCGLFVVHVELSLRSERVRRRVARTRYCDLSSVWTFAGALLLPPVLATVVLVVGYLHLYRRVSRPAGVPPHREIYSGSTVVLAFVVVAVIRWLTGVGDSYSSTTGMVTIALAMVAYAATNTTLVVSVIRLSQPGSRFLAILRGGDLRLESATLSLGGLVAAGIAPTAWPTVVLVFLPLLLLERTTLIADLEEQARTDAKTGLLSPEAWQSLVAQAHDTARRAPTTTRCGILLLDLDHFKAVNDRYGHLAGDTVLHAIGSVIATEIRDCDLAGRFGGEEFVIFLVDLPGPEDTCSVAVREAAERVRRRVEGLRLAARGEDGTEVAIDGLSVSVGAATAAAAEADPTTLLARADAALYAAKDAGRNCVRIHGGGTGRDDVPPAAARRPDRSA